MTALAAPERTGRARTRTGPVVAMLVMLGVLVVAVAAGLLVGSRPTAPADVLAGLLGSGPEVELVHELRLPRTLLAVLVGCALGLAGAIMQAVTRNPLADPGLLGVNAGAAVAVAVALSLSLASSIVDTVWWAMAGAAVASVVVHLIATRGVDSGSPARTVLAGTAVSAALVALTNGLVLTVPEAFDQFRFWSVGSLQNRGADVLLGVAPFIVVGIVGALAIGKGLDALSLGDDVAASLGVNVLLVRVAALGCVLVLCGAATAAAGPLAFVGLTVPHVARRWARTDVRWVLALSGLAGAVLVVAADVLGRVVARPGELEVGIVVALVGGPVFVHLVRRSRFGSTGSSR